MNHKERIEMLKEDALYLERELVKLAISEPEKIVGEPINVWNNAKWSKVKAKKNELKMLVEILELSDKIREMTKQTQEKVPVKIFSEKKQKELKALEQETTEDYGGSLLRL